jgi:hypothetical protein
MKKDLANKVLIFLLAIYCVGVVIHIAIHSNRYQWDFYGYYQCAKAYELGIDPYDANAVSAMAQRPVLSYVYPPLTLIFFKIFAKIDYGSAFHIFLILKCFLVIGIIALWRYAFFNKQVDSIFYIVCLLGFNSAIYLDLRAGNVSILEQFLIWLALACYLKRKYVYFCALIIMAAIFKLQPIALLFLLLFISDRSRFKYLMASFTAFGTVLFLQYFSKPLLFLSFLTNATHTLIERGITNPSTFTFIREMVRGSTGFTNIVSLNKISFIFYLFTGSAIIFVSCSAYRRLKYAEVHDKEKQVIFMGSLIYALISLRFKDYSFILLIPAAYYAIKSIPTTTAYMLSAVAVSLSAVHVTLPGLNTIIYFLWNYYPLVITYCLWVFYLWGFYSSIKKTKILSS